METNKHVLNKGWAEERNCTQSKLQQFYVRMFAATLWGKHTHTSTQNKTLRQEIKTSWNQLFSSSLFVRLIFNCLFIFLLPLVCCCVHFMCSAVVLCLFSYFFDDVLLWFLYSQLMCVYRTYPRTYICVHACRYVCI